MQPQMTKKDPPKFAIANGFVIGSLPEVLHWTSTYGDRMKMKINDHEVTDLLKAMLVPVNPMVVCSFILEEPKNLLKAIINFLKWIKTELVEL
jgi:hypothetical protein